MVTVSYWNRVIFYAVALELSMLIRDLVDGIGMIMRAAVFVH